MITVARHTIIAVPPATTWALVRDFNALPDWNDMVISSRIEDGPADRIGCRRILMFDDGVIWTHKLIALSDATITLSYSIVDTPPSMRMPIWDYGATIGVSHESANGACRIDWRADFATDHIVEMAERAGQVFESGFVGLRRKLLG